MAKDPNLSGDSCIFMEATPNDGGNHTAALWWMSPDIELTGPTSGIDKADPGMNNTIKVRVHQKGQTCSLPDRTETIIVELWVGNPSLVMRPNDLCSTKQIFSGVANGLPNPGTNPQTQIIWAVPMSPPPPFGCTDPSPESPGHKCLIARCYPDSLTPQYNQFYARDDQHYAQRNICIVPCTGGNLGKRMALKSEKDCGFNISTANLRLEEPESVTLQVFADLKPSKYVLEALTPGLKQVPGFKSISKTGAQGFALALPDFPDAIVKDDTRIGCLGRLLSLIFPPLKNKFKPKYEADIKLKPAQFTTFTFVADLSSSKTGDAHIFHLMQIGSDKRIQGGLTLAMVKL